jgi:glycosyltransferase involved in cell wall biosynthesis
MLARGLASTNYRFVVATSGNEPLAIEYRRAAIPVRTLTQRSIKHRIDHRFISRLVRLASRGGFDLIHAHLHSASLAAAVAARLSGRPLVLTHHSMNTWRPWHHRVLGRLADHQANVVIAVSRNIADTVARDGVRPRVIPNGVAVPATAWSPAEIAATRAELGVPPTAYVVNFVGRFNTDKNPLLFLDVAARVAARCPTAHFLLVGDGPLRDAVEARVRALGLEDRVTLAGFRTDAVDLHYAADVLALTSDSEGSPLVVLEAMARSRPVVATAVGDVPRQIVEGQTGFIVPTRDTARFAEAVVALANPELRAQLGRAARERVQERFSIEHCLAETAAVYREVLGQRAPARAPREEPVVVAAQPTTRSLHTRDEQPVATTLEQVLAHPRGPDLLSNEAADAETTLRT